MALADTSNTVFIGLYLPSELIDRLKGLCVESGDTPSDVISDLIALYFDELLTAVPDEPARIFPLAEAAYE